MTGAAAAAAPAGRPLGELSGGLNGGTGAGLRVRWVGTVPYREAWSLQQALHDDPNGTGDDRLLLLEHPPTYTLGRHADRANVLVDPALRGAELIDVDRGGDVTFHGPGQLVAYPILTLPTKGEVAGGLPDTPAYVALLEQVLIDVLGSFGLDSVGRQSEHPGVWVEPGTPRARKIAAVGVRISRGRSLHGVALNVHTDMSWFDDIVACGIADRGVTSMAAEGVAVDMRDVVDTLVDAFVDRWRPTWVDRSDVVWRHADSDLSLFSRGAGPGEVTGGANRPRAASGSVAVGQGDGTSVRLLGRLAEAGVAAQGAVALNGRKPDWMRAQVRHDADVLGLKKTVRDLGLTTVCEEAGCPNLSECWSEGTATFMVCGDRCTRACGFCLVDTRRPAALDPGEPGRVAEAVARMDLAFAVVTMVARDDLADGGAAHVAATVEAIRSVRPGTGVEVLISDLKGDEHALEDVLRVRPDVVNHNIETVARLQRAVRPSAAYARSLALLARVRMAGLTAKSGLVLGLGESEEEVFAALADLAAVGTSIVTIGQYLRPTSHHLPVVRWWTPDDFDRFKQVGEQLGILHVESSPVTRSSYHASSAADAAGKRG